MLLVPAATVTPITGAEKVPPTKVGDADVLKSCDVLTARLFAVVATIVTPLLLVKLLTV